MNSKCRCELCTAANTAHSAQRRVPALAVARKIGTKPQLRGATRIGVARYIAAGCTHGSHSSYQNHGCRCWPCTDANTAYCRARRAGAS